MADQTQCLNCGNATTADYCAHCGQRTATARLSMRSLWRDFLQAISDFDHGFLYTLKVMLLRPGITMKNYVAGQRVKLINPFRFFIICTALDVLVPPVLGFDPLKMAQEDIQKGITNQADLPKTPSSTQQQAMQKGIQDFVTNHRQLIQLITVPFIAIGFWLMYRKYALNFAENLVGILYNMGAYAIITTLLTLVFYSLSRDSILFSGISTGFTSLFLFYSRLRWAPTNFFGNLWRSLLGYVLGLSILGLTSVVIGSVVGLVIALAKNLNL